MNRRQVTAMLAAGGTVVAAGQWIARAPNAVAGGWATVELVNPVELIVAGLPTSVDMQVLGHGVSPFADAGATLRLVHRESGSETTARAVPTAENSLIARATITLDEPGSYSWLASPDGYSSDTGTALRPFRVVVATTDAPLRGKGAEDSQEDAAAVSTHTDILDSAFADPLLEVAAGATVTWTNTSAIPHQVVFEDLTRDSSPLLYEGDSFRTAFDEPGEYAYYCGPHPSMTGVVRVGDV